MTDSLDPILLALLLAVAPLVTSLLKQPGWPGWGKRALAVGVSAVFGLLALWFRVTTDGTEFTPATVVGYILLALLVGQAVYRVLLSGRLPGTGKLVDVNRYLEGIGNSSVSSPTAFPAAATNGEAPPGSGPGT